jgi:predicted phosphoadenosine phosphosulfate sulfurtransferase
MEFEEFVEQFNLWYAQGQSTACLVGIRAAESLNRFRTLMAAKHTWRGRRWTTWQQDRVFNAYPIYDWRTSDIWTYAALSDTPQNPLYDRMHRAGVPLSLQRICQPYGDDQRRGLWLYQIIEPDTWGRVVARVNGANAGAAHAQTTGNILGVGRITKPHGHTWESFARLLLETMPPQLREHYGNKIAVFLQWWAERGYPHNIPDELPARLESGVDGERKPSWRRIAKVLLRHDYWCKGLSFSQTKSEAYERYCALMRRRRREWGR